MPCFLDVLAGVRAAMPGVPHLVGLEYMSAATTQPGTVVWVPITDSYGPPKAQEMKGLPARWTRTEGVQVACWGKGEGRVSTPEADMRAALERATSVLFAIEATLGGSYRVVSGAWEANAPTAQFGRWYVLALEFEAPVTKPQATATVTAVEQETELAPAGA